MSWPSVCERPWDRLTLIINLFISYWMRTLWNMAEQRSFTQELCGHCLQLLLLSDMNNFTVIAAGSELCYFIPVNAAIGDKKQFILIYRLIISSDSVKVYSTCGTRQTKGPFVHPSSGRHLYMRKSNKSPKSTYQKYICRFRVPSLRSCSIWGSDERNVAQTSRASCAANVWASICLK